MNPSVLPAIWSVGVEQQTGADYFFNNAKRSTAHRVFVIQHTLAGEAFFAQRGVQMAVPVGRAMLFSHQEDSSYGYPANCKEPYQLRFMTLLPGSLRPLLEDLREEFGSVLRMNPGGEASALLEDGVEAWRQHRFRDRLHVADTLFRLVLAIYREQLDARQHEDPIAMGHSLLTSELGGKLGLKEIARRVGVSREHFTREYRRRYGHPPGSELRQRRLEHSRAMLVSTSLPIIDIAAACGFSDGDSFRKAYVARFGENPTRTRAREP